MPMPGVPNGSSSFLGFAPPPDAAGGGAAEPSVMRLNLLQHVLSACNAVELKGRNFPTVELYAWIEEQKS